jgi:hypothetical protein
VQSPCRGEVVTEKISSLEGGRQDGRPGDLRFPCAEVGPRHRRPLEVAEPGQHRKIGRRRSRLSASCRPAGLLRAKIFSGLAAAAVPFVDFAKRSRSRSDAGEARSEARRGHAVPHMTVRLPPGGRPGSWCLKDTSHPMVATK